MGRILGLACISVAGAILATPVLASSVLAAQTPGGPEWTAQINGRDLVDVDANDPLVLSPSGTALIEVELHNSGTTDLAVERIRLEGRILGLSFFVYTTDVNMIVEPGADDARTFPLNLRDLDGQATGSIPSQLVLLDADGETIDSAAFPVQIDGSLRSVYGTFGLAVAAMTVVLLAGALWRLATGRLSRNRWRRATTFATPGLGVGFVLTFTLSALNIVVPTTNAWFLMLLVGAVVGFVAGYLTPTPAESRRSEDAQWKGFTEQHADPSDDPTSYEVEDAPQGRRRAVEPTAPQQPNNL